MIKKVNVSVVIPTYNVEEYITECLDSVFKQGYQNIEVIVVDNGSTDQTVQRIKEYQSSFPQIILLKETTKGAPFARNKGLRAAKGKYIQFLDSDDLLIEGKISRQINLIESLPAMFVAGTSIRRDVHGNEKTKKPNKIVWMGLINSSLGDTCSNLWDRKHLLEIEGWNTSLKSSQEYDLMFRLLQKKESIVFDWEPSTIIRQRESGSISNFYNIENRKRYLNLRYQIYQYLSKKDGLKKESFAAINAVFNTLREIYHLDKTMAIEYFKKLIPNDFLPAQKGMYHLMFKLLGFEKTESIYSLIRKFK